MCVETQSGFGCQQEDVAGEAQGSPAAAEEPAAAPADDGADWDENDELLAMQQEAWVRLLLSVSLG